MPRYVREYLYRNKNDAATSAARIPFSEGTAYPGTNCGGRTTVATAQVAPQVAVDDERGVAVLLGQATRVPDPRLQQDATSSKVVRGD